MGCACYIMMYVIISYGSIFSMKYPSFNRILQATQYFIEIIISEILEISFVYMYLLSAQARRKNSSNIQAQRKRQRGISQKIFFKLWFTSVRNQCPWNGHSSVSPMHLERTRWYEMHNRRQSQSSVLISAGWNHRWGDIAPPPLPRRRSRSFCGRLMVVTAFEAAVVIARGDRHTR